MYDIGIIGGGTAGMTAAIYGQRAGKRTVIIEAMNYGGQITVSPKVENYPGIASVSGAEFSMNLLDQAMKLGAETELEQVTGIREEDGIKVIETEGKEYPCRTVIIATGVTHRHLGLDREEALLGAGVSYCATCDGAFFKGKDVAVIGGGNTALQDAEFLSNYCNKVYLVHRRDEFRGEAGLVEPLKRKENVEFVLSATVKELVGQTVVEGLILNNKKTGEDFQISVSGVFAAIGQVPENQAFAGLVRLDDSGFIAASEDCVTSCPGIFAAGDCRTKEVRQLTTAAADGAVAALAACKYISRQEIAE
ncbi:MAG: thioredoxin-disulfide reductase [Ruminococcus sp.]|nr:thioredoxin-disulfide reductase [Ruminococcus sp.]MCI9634002.1 thioredoxin-disulfide reductase [Ruminococcus sp.]